MISRVVVRLKIMGRGRGNDLIFKKIGAKLETNWF